VDGEQRNVRRLFLRINPFWTPERAFQRLDRQFQPRPRGKGVRVAPRLHFLRMNLRTTSGVTGIYSPFLLAVRLHMFLIRAILTQIKSHLNSELSGVSVHF
jgi:hypothetical protein